MNQINDFLSVIDGFIGGSQWFVFLLLGTGLFFTIYLKFPQFRYLRHSLRIVRGKFDKEGDEGDTSHFQALTTALSGTVGTGNIAGVALAIHLGGPAALFWMLVTAAVGMTTKFVEVTLSHKYREKAEDGSIAGGPMYYMRKRLNIQLKNKKVINTGKWLGAIFAVATILSSFGTGNLPQINSIANSMFETFGLNHILTGAVLSVFLAMVILGGIKRIAKVTSRLVPIMAVVYFIGAIAVIAYNYDNIIPSISAIIGDVFTGSAAAGGFLGGSIAFAFNRGVNRGLFSNEAGQGSAPIAHAAARAHEPVSEGLVALLEPFIDTIIICTLTGLVILSSGVWSEKIENQFQSVDMIVLKGNYSETNETEKQQLADFLLEREDLPLFTGTLNVSDGEIQNQPTILHARSVAEDVKVWMNDEPYSGTIELADGNLTPGQNVTLSGKSLMHSAPLTTVAFTRSWFGEYGKYIVSIGLLMFAFSTAISWSYYGGRAVTYLFGIKGVIYYRIIYVIGFFLASFTDTTIVWTLSGITIALMTIPNLIGILSLHKEMKSEVKLFWQEWHEHFPGKNSGGL
ncbi:alanine or glycine:cation symporter, AGCS family [Tangfeifania diversioriginum]|uniref:Alanine or glycine:cation symporter, AGCS family n=1 Tax=Tangfeifania diversioriginum TaxID=1168035 RepID=A0A1M6CLA2_9BACT|nr:amino acid carrier protein [Tangfeifania diversioriginum]SHI61760.1 alanine or glycine:cation symporter, AGCS family [Tangfeifania diversioriginum]